MIEKVENFVVRMREKPEHVRRRFAFMTSLSITGVIFLFWVTSFTLNATHVASANVKVKEAGPITYLTAGVGDIFQYAKDIVFGNSKATYESPNIEVLPGNR